MRGLGVLIPAIALVAVGQVFLHSAGGAEDYGLRQLIFLGVALVCAGAVLRVPGEWFERAALGLYLACLVLLLAVPFVGTAAGGALSWIRIGSFNIQPSEIAKVALVLALARFLRRREDLVHWSGLLPPAVLAFFLSVLILVQPDLGTAVTLVPVVAAMFFAAGMRSRHIKALVAACLLAAPLLWATVMSDVQKSRVLGFIWSEGRELGWAYQMTESRIAVGSGGLLGKGLQEGTQSRFGFLPAWHTDFIFAVISEEWGFAGSLFVLALYAALLHGIMSVARSTRDPFGRLVCVGVAMLFGIQVFVNAGMNVGLLPITGLTLPLVSYGGSSLVTFVVALALVMNVARHRPPVLSSEAVS